MTGSPMPRCPSCGAGLVVEMDPAAPPDADAIVLCADPPFRYVCASSQCPRGPRPQHSQKGNNASG
jgi:hypothetical protein